VGRKVSPDRLLLTGFYDPRVMFAARENEVLAKHARDEMLTPGESDLERLTRARHIISYLAYLSDRSTAISKYNVDESKRFLSI